MNRMLFDFTLLAMWMIMKSTDYGSMKFQVNNHVLARIIPPRFHQSIVVEVIIPRQSRGL
jgi:hypothetical protein